MIRNKLSDSTFTKHSSCPRTILLSVQTAFLRNNENLLVTLLLLLILVQNYYIWKDKKIKIFEGLYGRFRKPGEKIRYVILETSPTAWHGLGAILKLRFRDARDSPPRHKESAEVVRQDVCFTFIRTIL